MKVQCWFNANIDVVSDISRIHDNGAKPRRVGEVRSYDDFISGLKYAMEHGGYEVRGKVRISGEKRLGGTAAIFANFLAYRRWTVYLRSPMVSEELASLFQARSRVYLWRNGWVRADRVRGGKSKVNWIVEFRKGDKLGDVTASSSSRFIVSSHPAGYRPPMPEWLEFNVVGGLNHLKPREIRRIEPAGITHVELTYPPTKRHAKAMKELSLHASSVGMDYVEAKEVFGVDDENVIDFLEGTELGSVFIHAKGYFAGMWRGELNHLKSALERAACDGAFYATSLVLRKRDCSKFPLSNARPLFKKMSDRSICIVPYRVISDPVRMTGLGDTISASIISSLFPIWKGKVLRARKRA